MFSVKGFLKHDDYMTPKSAWEDINEYIPKDKIIWEAFKGDGNSGKFLEELGCKKVIQNEEDFFSSDEGELIVTNPPYSKSRDIMSRLRELDKPFIMIMPASKICTQYMREFFKDDIQIIIPKKRINFIKLVNGKVPENWKSVSNFDCFYYFYKMNLTKDIIWLD